MSIVEKAGSTADKAVYAFAIPALRDGEERGVHVSMIRQAQDDKLNFFMDVYEAKKLRDALSNSLEWIDQNKAKAQS